MSTSDDALAARSQLLDNITFGVSNNFPIECEWRDYSPINNTNFTSGNDIQVDIGGQQRAFFDPAYFRMAFQFNILSSLGSTTAAFAFDYNSKALLDWLEFSMNNKRLYKLEYVNRFAMIMSDLFEIFPYVCNFGNQVTGSAAAQTFTGAGVLASSQAGVPGAGFATSAGTGYLCATEAGAGASTTLLTSIATTNTTYPMCPTGANAASTVTFTQSGPLYFGKQQDPFYGQMQSKRRTGINLYSNTSSATTTYQYALSMKIPDFIIGEYAKKFIYLEAVNVMSLKLHLDTFANAMVQTVAATSSTVLNTLGTFSNGSPPSTSQLDTTASFQLSQVKFFGKVIIIKGGRLNELLQDAYVETSIPKVIQAANCYQHYSPTITAASGQIATGISAKGVKSVIITMARSTDNNIYNYFLTNNVGGFTYFQVQIGSRYFPMNKIDSSNYPLEFYEQWHGFPLGEPRYNGTNDMAFTLDTVPTYASSAKWGSTYTTTSTGGTAGTSTSGVSGGANNKTAIGLQTDGWNVQADGYNYSRTNTIFQVVIDNPNLYDHEFQGAPFDVGPSDLYINYTVPTQLNLDVTGTSNIFHIYVIGGVNHLYDQNGAEIRTAQ